MDIQGLRAFAVIVVILDHLFAWPSGGFVGVDVFFVISGFLITGHLVREWDKTGKVSFLAFYKGRIKRIMPAALLVLLVTVAASTVLLSKTRSSSVFWDGVWAALFAGNWRFASSGTDYFQAEGPVSPLQHFWSLAVEEQFYFVWPLILVLILLLVSRLSYSLSHARIVIAVSLGALCAASFFWALQETASAPALAYFSTFSRAWELGTGALLALALPALHMIHIRIRPILAWVGLIGLAFSVLWIRDTHLFPAPTALLPVVATALIIAAGTGGQTYLYPLTNPVASYIGNISYSLYLWHFPIIILAEVFYPNRGVFYYVLVLAITGILSVFAYHLFEDAIRKSSWLSTKSRKKKRATIFTPSYRMTALGFLGIITASCVAMTMMSPQNPPSFPPAQSISTKAGEAQNITADTSFGPELSVIQSHLREALAATEWPETQPSLDAAIGSAQAKPEVADCGMPESYELSACTIGNPSAEKKAVLLGNSAAMTFATPLRDALGDGWQLVVHGAFGCPYSSIFVPSADPKVAGDCKDRNERASTLISEMQPDAVFVVDSYTPHKAEGSDTPMSAAEWVESVSTAVSEFRAQTDQVVFLSPPPKGW